MTFVLNDICSKWHLFKMTFVQNDICSKWHLFKMTFVQNDFCSKWHLFNMTFVQNDICSKWHLFQMTFVPNDISSKKYFCPNINCLWMLLVTLNKVVIGIGCMQNAFSSSTALFKRLRQQNCSQKKCRPNKCCQIKSHNGQKWDYMSIQRISEKT